MVLWEKGVMGEGVMVVLWEEGMVLWEKGVMGMVLWEEGVMGDGVMGGGCWGMVLWEEGVMGGGCYGRRVLWEEGVMGDGVVGGGCWGDGVVGAGDGVMDDTSEPTNICRSDFWGLFSPLPSLQSPLSPISTQCTCTCVPLPPLP